MFEEVQAHSRIAEGFTVRLSPENGNVSDPIDYKLSKSFDLFVKLRRGE